MQVLLSKLPVIATTDALGYVASPANSTLVKSPLALWMVRDETEQVG